MRDVRILEGDVPELLSDGRGFVITGDERFLADYARRREDARAAVARLRGLVQTPDGRSLGEEIDAAVQRVAACVRCSTRRRRS